MSLLLLLALVGVIDGENAALRIHSQPGVEVFWDGVSLGSTDAAGMLTVSDIPPGTFKVALRKAGFQDFRKSVTITGSETTSLEAVLEVAGSPAPEIRTGKGLQMKKPGLGKPAQPVNSEQDNRLNELLKSAPKQGPLPVWPAASRPAPETTGVAVPIWPFVLGGSLLLLVFWLSRRLKPATISRSPALIAESDVLDPPHSPEKSAAFLSDLKKREELLEQGIEIVPNRSKGPVIDLDSGSVREVEEQ